jgi:hypothetical protein
MSEYIVNDGMVHAANEAIKLVKDGFKKSDGTEIVLESYTEKIANREPLSINDATKIVSHLLSNLTDRKHGWELMENMSDKRIMWQAQGGCQAFKWSHDIVQAKVDAGELDPKDVPNYVTPQEFLSYGGCY